MKRIASSIAGFWRNSRGWSLGWQLVIAMLVILVGALIAATVSDAIYGARSDKPANRTRGQTTNATTSTFSSSSRLKPLPIAAPSHAESYDRGTDFGGWIDVDGCKDTRGELLIRTSAVPVTFTGSGRCTVRTGRWTDPWSGVTATAAHDFQIDHTVPLANAWRSGAWAWSRRQRVAYANDVIDPRHLVPIVASENESKRDRGPDEWKPPNRGAWCTYARVWDRIKVKWNLSATRAEWDALVAMAATC